jgi:hypothetical protein
MAESKTFSHDETIGLIRAKAADQAHGDSFCTKIHRRRGVVGGFGGNSELTATLAGATVNQICSPETWLPKLVGGGNYIVRIFSDSEPGKQLGGDLIHQFAGDSKTVDPATLKSAGWNGPTELRYPEFGPPQQAPFVTLGANGVPIMPQQQHTAPPAMSGPTLPLGPSSMELELKEQLRQTQDMLRQQAAALAQRDRELADEKATRREEQLRREHAAQMSALESKIDRLATVTPAKSPIDTIAALAPLVTPLVQSMIQSNSETRQLMAKIQADSQAQFQALMMKSMERPAVSPEVTALMDRFQGQLEKLRETDPSQHSMISQMADAFGGMTSMMVNVMSQVADSGLIGGKQESMGMTIVKELAKAVEAFGRAGVTAGVPKRRSLPPRAPAAATATGPQRPAVVTQPPVTQPNGLSGVVNPLDDIEQRIRAEEDPAAIAELFVRSINDPAVQAEVQAASGLVGVFRDRLGDEWANDHTDYVQALLAEVQAKLEAAGIVVEDDEPGVEAAE